MESSSSDPNLPPLLALVIPTFKERENICPLIERIQKIDSLLPFRLKIVVVDDNSPDGTADVVRNMISQSPNGKNIVLIERPKPLGLGSAYLSGFAYSLEKLHADFVGEMDADLQHPPEVLVEMCKRAAGGYDVVIASRYVTGGGSRNWSLGRRVVSRGANLLAKIFLRLPVADATSGYRVLSNRAASTLLKSQVSSKGYAFQVESLYVYKKNNCTFSETPFEFKTRNAGKTKLNWKEIIRFAGAVVRTAILGVEKKKNNNERETTAPERVTVVLKNN
jgi:dolichol-phosphate mannosyltransferase